MGNRESPKSRVGIPTDAGLRGSVGKQRSEGGWDQSVSVMR